MWAILLLAAPGALFAIFMLINGYGPEELRYTLWWVNLRTLLLAGALFSPFTTAGALWLAHRKWQHLSRRKRVAAGLVLTTAVCGSAYFLGMITVGPGP
jgi:hypothetical protein